MKISGIHFIHSFNHSVFFSHSASFLRCVKYAIYGAGEVLAHDQKEITRSRNNWYKIANENLVLLSFTCLKPYCVRTFVGFDTFA